MLRAEGLSVPGRLADVALDLAPGQVTAIVGPNGAGKSTLLAALAGLIAGPVTLDGAPLASMTPRAGASDRLFAPERRCGVEPVGGGAGPIGPPAAPYGARRG